MIEGNMKKRKKLLILIKSQRITRETCTIKKIIQLVNETSSKDALRRAFYACVYSVFKVITLVGSNQCNYFENATACSKRMRKTTVATQH